MLPNKDVPRCLRGDLDSRVGRGGGSGARSGGTDDDDDDNGSDLPLPPFSGEGEGGDAAARMKRFREEKLTLSLRCCRRRFGRRRRC